MKKDKNIDDQIPQELNLVNFVRFLFPKKGIKYIKFQNRFALCATHEIDRISDSELSRALGGKSTSHLVTVLDKIRLQLDVFSGNLASEIMDMIRIDNSNRAYLDSFCEDFINTFSVPNQIDNVIRDYFTRSDGDIDFKGELTTILRQIMMYIVIPRNGKRGRSLYPNRDGTTAIEDDKNQGDTYDMGYVSTPYGGVLNREYLKAIERDILSYGHSFYIKHCHRDETIIIKESEGVIESSVASVTIIENPLRQPGVFTLTRQFEHPRTGDKLKLKKFKDYRIRVNGMELHEYLASVSTPLAKSLLERWENSEKDSYVHLFKEVTRDFLPDIVTPTQYILSLPIDEFCGTVKLELNYTSVTSLKLDRIGAVVRVKYPCKKLHHIIRIQDSPNYYLTTYPFLPKYYKFDSTNSENIVHYSNQRKECVIIMDEWLPPGSGYMRRVQHVKPIMMEGIIEGYLEDLDM